MPVTVVRCTEPDCQQAAVYKIAARWSDGRFAELKTYGMACPEHLGAVFREAETRWSEMPPSPGESLEEIGIYRFDTGRRDRQLLRLWGLEENYRTIERE